MTPRCLPVWFALILTLAIPIGTARANDDAASHSDAAPPDSAGAEHSPAEHSPAEPALAEPSAAEPSHQEAAPPEAAPPDYSSSDSYPSDEGEARSAPSGPAAGSRSDAEEQPAADNPEKKKGKKEKPYDYERSKYKSRELSENTKHTYRFNEKGDPVVSGEKKKPVAKKTKRSSSRASQPKLTPDSCGSAESCAEKKSDADAL